jgi:hypothetical protein
MRWLFFDLRGVKYRSSTADCKSMKPVFDVFELNASRRTGMLWVHKPLKVEQLELNKAFGVRGKETEEESLLDWRDLFVVVELHRRRKT